MCMNFNELEAALYHIRVNYFFADASNLRIQFSARGNGDTIIDVFDDNNKWVGNFRLSDITEEIALLQQGKIDFCDLSANNAEDEEE